MVNQKYCHQCSLTYPRSIVYNRYWKLPPTIGFEVVQYVEEQTKCDYETLKLQEYLNGYSHLLDILNDMAKINLLNNLLKHLPLP